MINHRIEERMSLLGNNDYICCGAISWGISGFFASQIENVINKNMLITSNDYFVMFTAQNSLYVIRDESDQFLQSFQIRINLDDINSHLGYELIEIIHLVCDEYEKKYLKVKTNEPFTMIFERNWGIIKLNCLVNEVIEILQFIQSFSLFALKK